MAVSGLDPFGPIERFAGLNLAADIEEIGFDGAIDLLDVDLDDRGRLRTRTGYSLFSTAPDTGSPQPLAPYYRGSNPTQILTVTAAGNTIAINSNDATIIATDTGSAARQFAAVGTPTASYMYFTRAVASIRRWDGTTFTSPAGMPAGMRYITVAPGDQRLVVAGGYASTNPSRVQFSDAPTVSAPNAVETWGANNYVELSPGDGENITGLATWQNYLFAFKQSKLFVFYGNSTDATGQPVFNYREINAGVGHEGGTLAIAPEGVYFVHSSGVYLTNGSGVPRKVSEAIEPLFAQRGLSSFYSGGSFTNISSLKLVYHRGRLILSDGSYTFVYDPQTEWWLRWSIGIQGAASFSSNLKSTPGTANLWFNGTVVGASGLFRGFATQTTDNGSTIVGVYQSGFSDMGEPAREKTIRETEVVGAGNVALTWDRDLAVTGSSDSVSFNGLRGLSRRAAVGELLSFRLVLTGSTAKVHRLVPMVREVRGVGERTS